MNETEVKSRTISYFKNKEYNILQEFELDCMGKSFKIDLVAFKWLDEYDLDAIAVECKGDVGLHALIETTYSQTREYQAGFPKAYLAVPKDNKVPEDILGSYGVGLLRVSDHAEEEIEPNTERSAPKLDHQIYGYAVRQKLVAYMTLKELTGKEDHELRHLHVNNFGFACWVDEFCNYCVQNDVFLSRDYYFSIFLDQKGNVMRALKPLKSNSLERSNLFNLIEALPGDFIFSVYRVFVLGRGLRSYKPVIKLPVSSLDRDFLSWVVKFAEENSYKTPMSIGRKVWGIDDLLPRREHLKRAEEVMKHLEPIKKFFESQ